MEDHPPDIPNPPPLSFQEHDAPLGSSSVGPTHSYQQSLPSRQRHYKAINQPPTSAAISEGEDGEVGSEQNLLYLPSSSQQAALTALQDHDDTTIFAWLTGLRCAANWFQPGCLSPQQLEAISALKECSNSLISTWLDSIRCGGQYLSWLYSYTQSSNIMAQAIPMRFTASTVTATWMLREPP